MPGALKRERVTVLVAAYLYVVLDICSVVGWILAHREAQNLATRLIRETIDKHGVREDGLTLHSDRGPVLSEFSNYCEWLTKPSGKIALSIHYGAERSRSSVISAVNRP